MATGTAHGNQGPGHDRAAVTLDRSNLPDLLISDRDKLQTQLEDLEVIVVRNAFCPQRALLSFAERLECALHGQFGAVQQPSAEDYLIVGDPNASPLAEFVRNGRVWENDQVLGRAPGGTSIMAIPDEDRIAAQTDFACTAAAWDALPHFEQRALAPLTVLHGFWQWMARESAELPLVARMAGGRHCLLVDDTAIQIMGMEFSASEAFIDGLREWVTKPAFVYRHTWEPGALVIWNSASVLFRGLPRPHNPMWKMAHVSR